MESSPLNDTDPDVFYCNQSIESMHYSVAELSRICAERILSYNIHSFHANNGANSDVMFALFNCSTHQEILVLSQTLFKSDNSVNNHHYYCHHSVVELRKIQGNFCMR